MTFTIQPLSFPVEVKDDWIERELTVLNGTRPTYDSALFVDVSKGSQSHCICGVKGMGKTSLLNKIAFSINASRPNLIAIGPLSPMNFEHIGGRYDLKYALRGSLSELAGKFPERIRLPDYPDIPDKFEQFPALLEKLPPQANPEARFLIVLDDLDAASNEDRALILGDLKKLREALSPRIKVLCAGNFLEDEFPSVAAQLAESMTGYVLGAFTRHEMDQFFANATRHSGLQFNEETRQVFRNWSQSVPYFCQALMLHILNQGFPRVPDWNLTPNILESTARKMSPMLISAFLLQSLTPLVRRARGDTQELLNTLLQSGGVVEARNVDWDNSVIRDLWRWGIIWRNARTRNLVWATPLLAKWFERFGPVIDKMPWGEPSRGMAAPDKGEESEESHREPVKRRKFKMKGGAPPGTPGAIERYVNLWFVQQRGVDESFIPKDRTLPQRKKVYLRVNIARLDKRTILEEVKAFVSDEEIARRFPETVGKPVPLEITLFSKEGEFSIAPEDRTQKLDLVRGKPTRSLYFPLVPLRTPYSQLRVCVFYRNHLLQSLNVMAAVTPSSVAKKEAQRANVEMAFSAGFSQVQELPARALWLGINQSADSTHTLNLKNSETALSRNLESKVEHALVKAREALRKVSFREKDDEGKVIVDERTGSPKKEYRFNVDNYPKVDGDERRRKRLKEDLTILAAAGSNLYQAIFGQVPTAEEYEKVQPLVVEMKRTLRDEQVIQIARLKAMEDIWPWAMLYDSVIDPDKVKDLCLAFRGDGNRALPYLEGVQKCHHRDPKTRRNKDKTIVCPYSFWGFKHIIEQPIQPGGKKAFSDLITEIKIGGEPVLQMPVENGLSKTEAAHINNMQSLRFKPLNSLEEITAALSLEPHVLYFFCHGKYDAQNSPYLQVGTDESLLPSELDELDFRWANSHGLVFINGCHTAELQPKDLASIMAPFVEAYASGIIGTEISVTTALAREFAYEFFKRFLGNELQRQRVGQIIKDLRLNLLMKFNPLGLVYTPYCSADLRMVH